MRAKVPFGGKGEKNQKLFKKKKKILRRTEFLPQALGKEKKGERL